MKQDEPNIPHVIILSLLLWLSLEPSHPNTISAMALLLNGRTVLSMVVHLVILQLSKPKQTISSTVLLSALHPQLTARYLQLSELRFVIHWRPVRLLCRLMNLKMFQYRLHEETNETNVFLLFSTGTYVTQVTATDADDPTYGNSARVVYSILHGQPYFSVDPKTGEALTCSYCTYVHVLSLQAFPDQY